MKTSIQLMLIILSTMALNCVIAMADEVKIPNNFQPKTPAFAEEVNENFSAVKTAVDDNFSRIKEKQNRVSGNCPPGESIRAVNDDGTVVCEADSDSGGDITAVNPGSYMSGGGQSGAVTMNVSGMPGVDYAVSKNPKYITYTTSEIISQTITAPTNGFVYAIFEADASMDHKVNIQSSMSCWITTNNDPLFTGPRTRTFYIPETTPADLYITSISASNMIPVPKGSTTIYVMGKSNASDDSKNTQFSDCAFYLLFFPTRY